LGILVRKNAHYTGGDFVMYCSFIVFTDDIDAKFLGVEWVGGCAERGTALETYHGIIVFELKGLGFGTFLTESFAIYESAV